MRYYDTCFCRIVREGGEKDRKYEGKKEVTTIVEESVSPMCEHALCKKIMLSDTLSIWDNAEISPSTLPYRSSKSFMYDSLFSIFLKRMTQFKFFGFYSIIHD